MFTGAYICSPRLLVFSYFYPYLLMFTNVDYILLELVYLRLLTFTRVYLCLPISLLFTLCLLVYTYAYSYLLLLTYVY